jgi:hypothetical protein
MGGLNGGAARTGKDRGLFTPGNTGLGGGEDNARRLVPVMPLQKDAQ